MKKRISTPFSFVLLIFLFLFTACNLVPGGLTPTPPGNSTGDSTQDALYSGNEYTPLGVGGGGAMSGFSISPYENLWFVGTDMGTLFKSTDEGKSWRPVNHNEAVYSSDLTAAVGIGFSSDGKTLFHAFAGWDTYRSTDQGDSFSKMEMNLDSGEIIRYWQADSDDEDKVYAGTSAGLLRSSDKGKSWSHVSGISGEAKGTFIDLNSKGKNIYHATSDGLYKSTDGGKSFSSFHSPGSSIRQFAGGRDSHGLTLAYLDSDASACNWGAEDNCGYVWISNGSSSFKRKSQEGGDFIRMAENDSQTIYVTGAKSWINQYGTKVWVSEDGGDSFKIKLWQMNWDVNPFEPWPMDKLEYSAVAMDVGWWDNGYESFDVNKRNSDQAGGTGYFFLHATHNKGDEWKAPFTKYADEGDPAKGKKWITRGIEVISIYNVKFHPKNSELIYGASADIGGIISEDGGQSWRVSKASYNSNYDYAFDENDDQKVFAASGALHDYPNEWHAEATTSEGGIYLSKNRGKSWKRLTPNGSNMNRQFLSVAYDSIHDYVYGGTQETGIVRSKDGGSSWSYFNSGLPGGNKIIPQIEIDPETGNAYALLTGDAPSFSNSSETGIYFLDVEKGSSTWKLLGNAGWSYPTKFAIDFKGDTDTLWLVDYENNDNWLGTGVWKTTNRGDDWERVYQVTHPTDIKIDPIDPDRVYVAAYHQLDNQWGHGGQLYTEDGGKSWKKNEVPPLQHNARSVTVSPSDPGTIFYSYFGGGILAGPNPSRN